MLYDLLINNARDFETYLPNLINGLSIFIVYFIAAIIAQKAIIRISRIRNVDQDVAGFIAQFAKTALIIVGGITALDQFKVDVTALVAALGLTGFALGFALKDLISNLLSGILILIHQPFKREDRIAVDQFEGIVTEIDLRYTTLEDGDKKYLVPNAILFSKGISVIRPPSHSEDST
jgi:small conductance mechanosensitive channel